MDIRDRIKQFVRVPASKVRPSPLNWRTHPKEQADALRGVLSSIGFAGAVLARELPDGSLEAIDGHLRLEMMGSGEVPVLVTDFTESEAKTALATYDPLGAMAGTNEAKLEELLRDVQTGNEAVAGMLEELATDAGILSGIDRGTNDINDIYQGMPEFAQEDLTSAFRVIVHFDAADDLKDFARLIGQKLTEKTKSTWHPYKEPIAGKEYTAGSDDDES